MEEQTSLCVIYRVIVNIDAVGQGGTALAINYRFLIAGNNLCDWHIVATLHYSLSNAQCIDRWVIGGHEENANEKTVSAPEKNGRETV